ncbi:MAG: ribose 5-phosphate isomerase A [Euryarchaeota archaeon]|nr:ribose 5-phosphate isomerase A [Euryarchaeota archaeon]
MDRKEELKKMAGIHAAGYVKNGMKVGLGTGSTVKYTILELGRRIRNEGLIISCVPTSISTEKLSIEQGIKLYELSILEGLDLVIDGADEFDENLTLIKGGGGALVREKIIAQASEKMIVVADESKRVEKLGKFALPVEVIKFSWKETQRKISEITNIEISRINRRMNNETNEPMITDNGNFILDLSLEEINNPSQLENELIQLAGVLDCGLFCDIASTVVLANPEGIEIIEKRA